MARLPKGAETPISMAFLVMCAEKNLRLLRSFLSLFFPGYATGNGQAVSGLDSGTYGSLKHTNHWPLDNREFELPTPCYLAAIESSVRFAFLGVPVYAHLSGFGCFRSRSNLGAAFINGFGLKLRLISEAGLSFPPLSAGITGLAPQAMAFQQACPFG